MNKLRRIHLYLGCAFAPLLSFFAISGVWQTFYFDIPTDTYHPPHIIALLSALHRNRGLKGTGVSDLSSTPFKWLVVAMALSLLLTMVLGVIMAFRFGHARLALLCLAAGLIVPVLLVVVRIAGY